MSYSHFVALIFSINYFTRTGNAVPQIFGDKYSVCEFDFGEKHPSIFTNKLWTVETRNFILHFSFCKHLRNECRNQTSSCLLQKRGRKVIDLGEFRPVDADNYQIESLGTKCPNSNQNYTLTVTLECSDRIKPKPVLIEENDCHFEIIMMKPDCRPKCTDLAHGSYLIDIRTFPVRNIDVEASDGRKFKISLCGSNQKCGSREFGSCEFLNDSRIIPLSKTESQSLNYDISKNELTARGRFKNGRDLKEFQVLLKCNWDTEMSNPIYQKVPIQGKKYHFELESSYGCVKLPQDCFIRSLDNLNYNLSNIYSPNGWEVSRVPRGDKIKLNMCGPLKLANKNRCTDQYSQVCQISDGNYINRGSILSSLNAEHDIITAVFSSGSTCRENSTLSYNTIIEFECSKIEDGPVFKQMHQCTLFLTWKTPHACPVDFYKSQNCYMNDWLGNRNVQKLASDTDKVYSLSPDVELVYNLCRPITSNCDIFTNVSFCLKKDRDKDLIIGWDKREVISDQGLLRMELSGRKCSNSRSQSGVTVNLVCSYQQPSPPPQIIIIEDGCKFNATIFTPLACLSENKFEECVYHDGNFKYDLSPLVQKNRNYVIANGEVEYILNVCGPIITGPGALCRKNAMSCLRNKTETNIKHRYTSLGVVSKPKLVNNSLMIESTMGTYCEGFGYYRTVIYFECSQQKLQPVFLGKEPCTYKFLWKTPEACPIKRNCIVGSKTDHTFSLTNLEEKIFHINTDDGDKYSFDLCTDSYIKFHNGTSKELSLNRTLYFISERPYLTLDLSRECTGNDINKINFEFDCDHKEKDYFQKKAFENCVLNMSIHTHIVCSSKNEFYNIDKPETTTPVTPTTTQHKCKITSPSTGSDFYLDKIKSTNVTYGKLHHYLINFDGQFENCTGFMCRNFMEILPKNRCPQTSFDGENNVAKLIFETNFPCSSQNVFFQLTVLLKCDESKTDEKIIKNEICKLTVEYSQPEACSLFPKQASNVGMIGGLLGGIVLIIIGGLIGIFFYKKRHNSSNYLNISLFPKSSIPIYRRDSTL